MIKTVQLEKEKERSSLIYKRDNSFEESTRKCMHTTYSVIAVIGTVFTVVGMCSVGIGGMAGVILEPDDLNSGDQTSKLLTYGPIVGGAICIVGGIFTSIGSSICACATRPKKYN